MPRNDIGEVVADLKAKPVAVLANGTQIAKLLVARRKRDGNYLLRGLTDVEQFLKARVEKYPQRKYGDRMSLGPVLFQAVIEQTAGHLGE